MSGKTWANYAIAIVVGVVVGVLTAGIGLAAYAGTVGVLAFGVTSSLLAARNMPKNQMNNAVSQDLEMAAADESRVVPVLFGMQRFAGNFIRYDKDSFRAHNVEEESAGGKGGGGGGGPVTVGFDYYLSYLYGLCMGPVDGIGDIWDGNAMTRISTGYTAFSGHTQDRTLVGNGYNGTVTLFRGSEDQPVAEIGGAAKADTHLRYPYTCYGWFENMYLGGQPSPRSMLFEVHRWPVCVDDLGVAIPGMKVQGSNDDTGRCWYDANPAAILFEIFTNGIWGRGMKVEQLDIPSFVAASEFFADNDIGLSLVLSEQTSLPDIIDFVRRHVNTAVVWDGEKLFLTVLMNPNDAAVPVKITRESMTGVELTRPAWPDLPNEVRLEFTDRLDSWRPAVAHMQNNAGIATVQMINSQLVTLNGFTNRYLAEAQCARIMMEMGYPQAKLTGYTNRFNSRLLPGQRVHLVWEEFTEQATNTFWRVAEFDDSEQSDQGIRLVLVEDLYATAYMGPIQSFTPALPGFAGDSYNDSVNESGDSNEPIDPGDLQPIRAYELPIGRTLGTRQFAILQNTGSAANQYGVHQWALHSGGPFITFASTRGWCLVGKLLTNIPTTTQTIQRGSFGITFDFDLLDPAHEADLLASANKVLLDTDNIQVLLTGETDFMVIGNEVFAVGKVVETSPGVYQASNFIRALKGSVQAAHAINDDVYFIPSWVAGLFVVSQGDIPSGVAIDFKTNVSVPITGVLATEFPWVGPSAGAFLGLGSRAYLPGYISHTVGGGVYNVNLRPRWHSCGAESNSDWQNDLGNVTAAIPDGYTLMVEPFNGGTSLATRTTVLSAYTSDADPSGGVWQFSYTYPPGTTKIRVWAAYKGGISVDFHELTP